MSIGKSIKTWRMKEGLTQKQLAEASHVSEISIRKYEAGDRIPKIGTLSKIARALNITIGELDSDYTTMSQDRSDAAGLESQIKTFLNNISNMNITENVKQQTSAEINSILKLIQELNRTIDTGISNDAKMQEILTESARLKQEIRQAECELDEIFLSTLHQLNRTGQDKAIQYALDLTKISEYRKS